MKVKTLKYLFSFIIILCILAPVIFICTAAPSTVKTEKATVVRIIDGDTIKIKLSANDKEETCRLIGVNTPESTTRTEYFGKEASEYTKKQLTGKTVYIQKDVSDRDRYGRILRYVWLSQPTSESESEIKTKLYNSRIISYGYGQVMTVPPDIKYQSIFLKLQDTARKSKVGLWKPVTSTTTPSKGDIIIKSVDLIKEIVIIKNAIKKDINLTDWRLVSTKGNQTYKFKSGYIVKAGAEVQIISGPKAIGNGKTKLLWTKSYIWNNDGDTAELYNNKGALISKK